MVSPEGLEATLTTLVRGYAVPKGKPSPIGSQVQFVEDVIA
jgi:hypothetical protein